MKGSCSSFRESSNTSTGKELGDHPTQALGVQMGRLRPGKRKHGEPGRFWKHSGIAKSTGQGERGPRFCHGSATALLSDSGKVPLPSGPRVSYLDHVGIGLAAGSGHSQLSRCYLRKT